MDTILQTARLRLRRFRPSDIEHLYALDNDPEVMRYINGGAAVSRETIADEVLPLFLDHPSEDPGLGFWAAEQREGRAFVGWFSLRRHVTHPGEAILGYRLMRRYWGRGYATEGARALLGLCFRRLGVARVTASTYEENIGSRRVMAKLGMHFVRAYRLTPEDLARIDTAQVDADNPWPGQDVEYALTREEWEGGGEWRGGSPSQRSE